MLFSGKAASAARLFIVPTAAALLFVTVPGRAQQTETAGYSSSATMPDAPQPTSADLNGTAAPTDSTELSMRRTPQRLLTNEWAIVKSPAQVRGHDMRWLLPLAGVSALAIATDTRAMRDVVSHDPGINDASNTASGILRDLFIAAPIAMFGVGQMTHQQNTRDTGLLGGEAMLNAFATDYAIKYVTLRERPAIANARGHFFETDSASDPSFVSGHSIVAWSSAAVLAEHYSRPWQQAGIYTLAGGVSFTRVLAQDHFPSDVVLGAVSGWLIGHYVYSAHRSVQAHAHVAVYVVPCDAVAVEQAGERRCS